MMRCTTILCLLVALLSACSSPRKACRKADRHIARAVWLCPDVLQRDSTTVELPAFSDTLAAAPARPDIDSLLAACRALNDALTADRQRATAAPAPARPPSSVPRAVQQVQQQACNWTGFTEKVGRVTITVNNIHGMPVLFVEDPGEVVRVPCPPVVSRPMITGVAEWYRTYFWSTIGILVLLLIAAVGVMIDSHASP